MKRVDWLTPREAAHRLGTSVSTVRRLAAADVLAPESRSGRLRVSTTSVTQYVAEESRWVTRAEAARLLECSVAQVARLVGSGGLTTRAVGRGRPSILRDDVASLSPGALDKGVTFGSQ